ncbi:glutamate--cysteine ligase [Pseudonocardia sp.]|uniref:glutamate--cysteine ligase n=1 Tax=Pseudonocardia sp. TaxID=60912 RepID=UPI003D1175DB
MRSVGIEEEFVLVDPDTAAAAAVASTVLRIDEARRGASGPPADEGGELTSELHREQLETGTRPSLTLAELRAEVVARRADARRAAENAGVVPVALATYPLAVDPTVSAGARTQRILERFGRTAQEQLTCGCHVHVGVEGADEGVAVLDRMRPWLAVLAALSVNSPFWDGKDSNYASYRSQVWSRWPSAGPFSLFGTAARYTEVERTLLGTGTLLDEGMVYFDARLSRRHPTVEIRVADVCRDPDDAVLIAALARALVDTAAAQWRAGVDPDPVPTEVLRLAAWRAGRSGLAGELVRPGVWVPAPARTVVDDLVAHVGPALSAAGDLDVVAGLLDAVVRRGTGAERQRAVYARTRDLRAVVLDAADATHLVTT